MKKLSKLPFLICLSVICATIAFTAVNRNYSSIKENNTKIISANKSEKEMRGIWVTYMDLDMSGTNRSFAAFKKKFNHIADTAKKDKFNTLVVQVRPFSDALYYSDYFPASHILSGKQGKNPGYDALKYMCEYTHRKDMYIHAWINPYRISSENSLNLSKDNPYKRNTGLGVKVGNGIYYNPASQDVRALIENGVKEIVEKYDVDGIQFDDYFYPTQSKTFDAKSYSDYKKTVNKPLPLDEWRKNNVNILIAECYNIVHSVKKNIKFGISPQGNIPNNAGLYADVEGWCGTYGYIDYICPQLYYSLENPALKFSDALNAWKNLKYAPSVSLYIGIAGYKTGTDSDGGTWAFSDKILQDEVKLVRKNNINGFMFYSFSNLESKQAAKEVVNLIKILD